MVLIYVGYGLIGIGDLNDTYIYTRSITELSTKFDKIID